MSVRVNMSAYIDYLYAPREAVRNFHDYNSCSDRYCYAISDLIDRGSCGSDAWVGIHVMHHHISRLFSTSSALRTSARPSALCSFTEQSTHRQTGWRTQHSLGEPALYVALISFLALLDWQFLICSHI